jgi:nitrogenase molybdenum-cofactor synthesis protein NifE
MNSKENTNEPYIIPITNLLEEVKTRRGFVDRREAMHHCCPAGGGWGVVRVACLVPEVEVVFVIPIGCGRHGGIASFANKTEDKLSYFIVEEVDLVVGRHLEKLEGALDEVLEETKPKGLIICSTCMDDLLGSDYESLMLHIEKKYNIPVKQGKMNPILSQTPKSPELMIQKTIYDFFEKAPKNNNQLNVMGGFTNINDNSELYDVLQKAGVNKLLHITDFDSFEGYKNMEKSSANLLTNLAGLVAAKHLEKKIGQPYIPVYNCFRPESIKNNYELIEKFLDKKFDLEEYSNRLAMKIESVKNQVLGLSVAIGSVNASPYELARLLTELGMKVPYIIGRAVPDVDKEHVDWLSKYSPNTLIIPDLEPSVSMIEEKLGTVDICFGLDVALLFNTTSVIELTLDENPFGYSGTIELIDKIVNREVFNEDLIECIYNANLVI